VGTLRVRRVAGSSGGPAPDCYREEHPMPPVVVVDPRFPYRLRELRQQRGLSLRELAKRVFYGKSYLHELETGDASPRVDVAARLDEVLGAAGELARVATAMSG